MDTMTFNGQQIALRHFSNSYEKMVYADNVHITEISIYYCGIRIGHSELMHCNDLHLFKWSTGVDVSQTTQVHMNMHMSKWMEYYGILNLKVLLV